MKAMRHLITVSGLLVVLAGFAQQQNFKYTATGSCVIANISPETAKERALFDAKIDALRQAGIPENVLAEVTQMGEIFTEISNIEIGGAVTGYKIVNEDIKIVPVGNSNVLVFEVVIQANVLKYNRERDPSFQIQVQGIKSAYREKETFTFSVTPFQNGYLRIFLFEEDGAGDQLYPDSTLEPDRLFQQNETVRFPANDHYNYVLAKTDKAKYREINRILFLFLKDNIHFVGKEITLQSILTWKAGISPDRRTQEFREFTIER